jgi:archaellum component FlaF (FlaF/FlaG flagellin family)
LTGSVQRCAALVASLVAASFAPACGHQSATPPQAPAPAVGVELKATQPSYAAGAKPQITITLHNNGSQACSLPTVADGSVEVVSVTRDGSAVLGRPGHDSLFNGMAAVVAQSLRSVAPGESISVPLDVEISTTAGPRAG